MNIQSYFHDVADLLPTLLEGREVFTCTFSAEDSDFVRFNRNEIRQAGSVAQRVLSLDLMEGRRHSSGTITLSGDLESDRAAVARLMKDLREQRRHLPEDPYLLYATEVRSTERRMENKLPSSKDAIGDIRAFGQGKDLVGIYASGGVHSGFVNALGQRNWYSNYSFHLDWSFYHQKDKAVKTAYAGFEWQPKEFRRKVDWATEQLGALSHQAKTLQPGRYRAYLAPGALVDIVGFLSWGGFGLKAHRTKQTPLLKMVEAGARLHPSVSIVENVADGISPNFQEAGFLKPDRVPLITGGGYDQCLVSPRSAQEYGVATNGASAEESPVSIDVAGGAIPSGDVLRRLDRGIYINNVWYLNYSDRMACRTTGMTRFATFWVENGRIQAPINVMRFDETIYRMLGENLVGLTAEREMILDASTYGGRSTQSSLLPGALVEGFTLTL